MTSSCSFAHDHALGSAELAEHAASCSVCARRVAVRALAREAWCAAKLRDDRTARGARERRLLSVGAGGRNRQGGLAWRAALAGALVATAACLLIVLRHATPLRALPTSTPSLVSSSSPPVLEATPEEAATAHRPLPPRFRVTGLGGGRVTTRDGTALALGDPLEAGDEVEVGPHAVVQLLWAIDLGELGDASAASSVEVRGPAEVRVGDGPAPALVLRAGEAQVTAGRVSIGRRAEAPVVIEAGQTVRVGSVASHPLPAVSAVARDDGGRLRRAEEAAARGDRGEAESTLRALLQEGADPDLRARAAIRLAELLLARGASAEAEALLEPIAFGREPRRAADAIWLYARSRTSPRDRASAWARYVSGSPPPAMRALAKVEWATALLDAGDVAGARTLAAELDEEPPDSVTADARRVLEARLRK